MEQFRETGPTAALDFPGASGLLDRKDRKDRFRREKSAESVDATMTRGVDDLRECRPCPHSVTILHLALGRVGASNAQPEVA